MDKGDSGQLRLAIEEKWVETQRDLSPGPWGHSDRQSHNLSCHNKATHTVAVTGLVSPKDPPLGLWTAIVSLCPHMASLCVSLCPTLLFLKGHQSYWSRTPTLRPHPKTWPRSAYKFWEDMIQSMTLPLVEVTVE